MPPTTRPRSFAEVLRLRAAETPDVPVFTFLRDGEIEDGRLTFASLARAADRVAAALRAAHAPGDAALLLYEPGLDFVVAYFGCLLAGVVAVPAPVPAADRPQRVLPRLRAIVADAGPVAVLATAALRDRLAPVVATEPSLGRLAWLDTDTLPDGPPVDAAADPDDVAHLQYTSGSTGAPKGVVLTHANLLHGCASIARSARFDRDSVQAVWVPHLHDYGLVEGILHPVWTGLRAYLMAPLAFVQKPVRWLRAITRYGVTHTGGPDFAYDLCARRVRPEERAGLDLSTWAWALNAAEPVRPETLRRFAEAYAPFGFRMAAFQPAFGLAEATLQVTNRGGPTFLSVSAAALERGRVAPPDGGRARELVGSGVPALDTEVRIVGADGRPCDGVGEIWVRSPGVARGYLGKPEATAETFGARLATGEGPFLRTGDLGFLHDGELFVTGRAKDLIIVRGQNIHPQDVEWAVDDLAREVAGLRVGASVAFAVERDDEERLVVVAELDPAADRTGLVDRVCEAVAAHLDVRPWAVELVPPGSIPRTTSGKRMRQACREAFLLERGQDLTLNTFARAPSAAAETVNRQVLTPPAPESVNSQVLTPPASESVNSQVLTPPAPESVNSQVLTPPAPESVNSQVLTPPAAAWEARIVAALAAILGVPAAAIDPRRPFAALGMDSVRGVQLVHNLDPTLSPTVLWAHPTIRALARHLAGERASVPGVAGERHEPIAIVGLGCRFPGADGPDAFWRLLRDGVDAVGEVTRWPAELFDADPDAPGCIVSRRAGLLPAIDGFDAAFFGVSPREAARMDPQHRLLLEVAWEALEHGGFAPDAREGTRTGVFVGISTAEYRELATPAQLDAYTGTGNLLSMAAGRVAWHLGAHGPALAVDTACSSSLVAVHLAVRSLRAGECELALAGGVNLLVTPGASVMATKLHALSSTGTCRAFDAGADGYVRGEGCGVVVLKRLSAALADGDRVLAVIRGTATNHDGRSNGLTAPSGPAQEQVIRDALRDAGVAPADVAYVEAHGTGTPLGDPVELHALGAVLGEGRSADRPARVGSVKTNVGHLEAAAGVAGLIKATLALSHGEVPASLHFAAPNPHVRWAGLPLRVASAREPWPAGAPRVAGVSSFGMSGTNAHVVLEGPPPSPADVDDPGPAVVAISARTDAALRAVARGYADHANALADLAYTAATGRAAMDERAVVIAATAEEARAALLALADGAARGTVARGKVDPARRPRVAFLYTGQGAAYAGMATALYAAEPVFRAAIDRCAGILGGLDLAGPFDDTARAQPALVAIAYALGELWRAWGVVPDVVLGHSVGECAAAIAAEVWSLEEGLRFVATRGRLMRETAPGEMWAVDADADEVEGVLGDVALAAENGPGQVVLAGAPDAMARALAQLRGVRARKLEVDRAFHSALMDPILGALGEAAPRGRAPAIPLIPTAAGDPTDPAYWVRHAREPVRFGAAVEKLDADVLIEIGPHPVLLALAPGGALRLPSLRRDRPDLAVLRESAARLWARGGPVDLARLVRGRKIALPTYPFERQRHWIEAAPRATAAASLAGAPLRVPGATRHQVVPVGLGRQPWLADHRIHGEVVVPAAFFVSVVLAVAKARLGLARVALADVTFLRRLAIEGDVDVHVSMEPRATGGWTVHVATAEGDDWRTHVEGVLREAPAAGHPADLAALRTRPLDLAPFYDRLAEADVVWRPGWRRVAEAYAADGRSLVRVTPAGEGDAPLHPVVLDNAFGTTLAASLLDGPGWGEQPYLPWAIGEVRCFAAPTGDVWAAARVREGAGETVVCDLSLHDVDGVVVAEVDGLAFKRAPVRAFRGEAAVVAARPAPVPVAAPVADVDAVVRGAIAQVLALGGPGEVPGQKPLKDLGLDSLMAVELRGALAERTGLTLPATLAFDHPTADALAAYLGGKLAPAPRAAPVAPRGAAPTNDPVAIVGMACRFPGGADTPEGYWALLRDGVDAVVDIPKSRFDVDAYYANEIGKTGTLYSRRAGLLTSPIDGMDARFFGIRPREAKGLDPQQRLLLETTWEALERAGIAPDSLAGSRTGVFLGMSSNDYAHRRMHDHGTAWIDAFAATGNAPSIAAGRIAYHLGLEGPCVTLDTACSSALVAVHLACQSLRAGECDLAIVAGVNLILSPLVSLYFSQLNALASDGKCKTFDAAADGYVRGEGCGVIVLKRLADARADRDPVCALVRGTAVSQDGRTNGLTAPSGPAQARVIREALRQADLEPAQIDYVEAHGTGTPLGDPIEAGALGEVFAARERPLLVGSVKTNIGHLEAAAGVAGLMKVALSLANAEVPAHLHFSTPSPHVPWDRLPLRVPTAREAWPRVERRRAGVSAFGFSGTNAHVVLEEAPDDAPAPAQREERPVHVLTLSADTPEALRELAARIAARLGGGPGLGAGGTPAPPELGDLCFTLNVGRARREHRLALAARDGAEARDALLAFAAGDTSRVRVGRGSVVPRVAVRVGLAGELPFGAWPAFAPGEDAVPTLFRAFGVDVAAGPDADVIVPVAGEDPWAALMDGLARAWAAGARVDWRAVDAPWARRRVVLPTYPFQRERFWFDG